MFIQRTSQKGFTCDVESLTEVIFDNIKLNLPVGFPLSYGDLLA